MVSTHLIVVGVENAGSSPAERTNLKEYMSKNKYEIIGQCKSFPELVEALYKIGIVQGSRDAWHPEDTIRGIEAIRNGAFINRVTRTYGIRAKVSELITYERAGL